MSSIISDYIMKNYFSPFRADEADMQRIFGLGMVEDQGELRPSSRGLPLRSATCARSLPIPLDAISAFGGTLLFHLPIKSGVSPPLRGTPRCAPGPSGEGNFCRWSSPGTFQGGHSGDIPISSSMLRSIPPRYVPKNSAIEFRPAGSETGSRSLGGGPPASAPPPARPAACAIRDVREE